MFIYASFPMLGYTTKPLWVDELKNNTFVKSQNWVVYDPTILIGHQNDVIDYIPKSNINKIALEHHKLLKLNELSLSNSPEAIQQLQRSDTGQLSSDIVYKDLFLLMRSDVVLVDLNKKSAGGTPQEVLYAHLLNIPIIGISHMPSVSPWMHYRIPVIANPKNIDDLIKLITIA